MHKIGLFSDPHIGLNRRAHTTAQSRKNLTGTLSVKAMKAATWCNDKAHVTICGGDLFDQSHNDETTILHGLQVAQKCDVVLEGNHDVPNREGTKCSTNVLSEALGEDSPLVISSVGTSNFKSEGFIEIETVVLSVPHHSSQELFDETIEKLLKAPEREGWMEIVVMHCNYECGYADNEISLNLTSDQADQLLNRFDYIFLGHEHESRVLKDGQLIIMGNTHPTSFSDISDKYMWFITEDNEVIKEKIWDKSAGHIESDYTDESVWRLGFEPQFIDVVGKISAEDYAGVADFMVKLWKDNPNALMIRNNVEVIESEIETVDAAQVIDNLPAHVAEELKDDKVLLPLWNEYVNRVGG